MATVLVDPAAAFVVTPPTPDAHPMMWWAERGLIHWEDQVTGEYGEMMVADALVRVEALATMLGNKRFDRTDLTPAYRAYMNDFLNKMLNLCEIAHNQGRPDVPEHVKAKAEEVKQKRSSQVVICQPEDKSHA